MDEFTQTPRIPSPNMGISNLQNISSRWIGLRILFIYLFIGTNWEFNYKKGTKVQPKQANQRNLSGNQEIMPIYSLTFQVTTKLLLVTIRLLTPPNWIKSVKDVLVGHVWGFFQVHKSPFPFNPTLIMQGVPNDLTCVLNGPLHIIKNQIIPLALDNPRKTTSQKELYSTEPFQCLAQRLVKEALHHRKGFTRPEIPPFGKELPNDVGSISRLLNQWTAIEPMFNWFHRLRTTMRASFVDLLWDFTTPLVNCQCLVDDQPQEGRIFLCLSRRYSTLGDRLRDCVIKIAIMNNKHSHFRTHDQSMDAKFLTWQRVVCIGLCKHV